MYLMRYSGDTGSGIQVESHLFLSQDAARAFMKADFETEREAYLPFQDTEPQGHLPPGRYPGLCGREGRVHHCGHGQAWRCSH